jgi:hypothetical protein
MIWIAVIALNLAVFQGLFANGRIDALVGGAAVWVVLQVAAAKSLRNRGDPRYYWLGFVAAGTLTSLTLITARVFPGSILGKVWTAYTGMVESLFFTESAQVRVFRLFGNLAGEIAIDLAFTAVEFTPLVLAAWAGGFLTRRIASRIGIWMSESRTAKTTQGIDA